MNLVKGNINFTNQLLDTADKAECNSSDSPIKDLTHTLKSMEPKLFELIATLDNEDMMKVCLLVNDDLHKTFIRYEAIKKGGKGERFIPGESQQNTALSPTMIYEQVEASSSAFT